MLINCKLKYVQISYLDKYISLKIWKNWFEFKILKTLLNSSLNMLMWIELAPGPYPFSFPFKVRIM